MKRKQLQKIKRNNVHVTDLKEICNKVATINGPRNNGLTILQSKVIQALASKYKIPNDNITVSMSFKEYTKYDGKNRISVNVEYPLGWSYETNKGTKKMLFTDDIENEVIKIIS